jgi:GTPase SAR1 family protein
MSQQESAASSNSYFESFVSTLNELESEYVNLGSLDDYLNLKSFDESEAALGVTGGGGHQLVLNDVTFVVFIGHVNSGKSELVQTFTNKKTSVSPVPNFDSETIDMYTRDEEASIVYVDYSSFCFDKLNDNDLQRDIIGYFNSLESLIALKYKEKYGKCPEAANLYFGYVLMHSNGTLSLDYLILINYMMREQNRKDKRRFMWFLCISKFDEVDETDETRVEAKRRQTNEIMTALPYYSRDILEANLYFISSRASELNKEYNDLKKLFVTLQCLHNQLKYRGNYYDDEQIRFGICGSGSIGKSTLLKQLDLIENVKSTDTVSNMISYNHRKYWPVKFYDNPGNELIISCIYQFAGIILVIKDAYSVYDLRLINYICEFNQLNSANRIQLFIVKTHLDKEWHECGQRIDELNHIKQLIKKTYLSKSKLNVDEHVDRFYCVSLMRKYVDDADSLNGFNSDLKQLKVDWLEKTLSDEQSHALQQSVCVQVDEDYLKAVKQEMSYNRLHHLGVFGVNMIPFLGSKIEIASVKNFIKLLINKYKLNVQLDSFKEQQIKIRKNFSNSDILAKLDDLEKKYSNINEAANFIYNKAYENCMTNPDNKIIGTIMSLGKSHSNKNKSTVTTLIPSGGVTVVGGLVKFQEELLFVIKEGLKHVDKLKQLMPEIIKLSGKIFGAAAIGTTFVQCIYSTYVNSLIEEEIFKILENDAKQLYMLEFE